MSRWTHNICLNCWTLINGERMPAKFKDATDEKCCYCGMLNTDGIYVREDPANLLCKGTHA